MATITHTIELNYLGEGQTSIGHNESLNDRESLSNQGTSDGHAIAPLPPQDRGRDAWLFLVAAFMIETLVWGLPFSVVRFILS
jgi:hypothetical protein